MILSFVLMLEVQLSVGVKAIEYNGKRIVGVGLLNHNLLIINNEEVDSYESFFWQHTFAYNLDDAYDVYFKVTHFYSTLVLKERTKVKTVVAVDERNKETSCVDAATEIEKFKDLFDRGLITQEEYDEAKKRIISKL